MQENKIVDASERIRDLVIQKNQEYGDGYPKIEAILKILYPNGIPVDHYKYLPKLERNIEKLCRIAGGSKSKDIPLDICGIWLNQVAEELD